jgi:hypothetical protein
MPDKKTLRTFGIIWSVIFFVIGYKYNMNVFFLSASLFFIISAVFFPEIYFKIQIFQGWVKFGNFLGKINSKIIIFIMFFFLFVPIGLFLRLIRKDLLHKKLSKETASYFFKRLEQPGSMINQF